MTTSSGMQTLAPGLVFAPGHLDRTAQEALVVDLRTVLDAAPFFVPRMPKSGKPFSVKMSNCGPLGWVSDETGYRYQAAHPDTRRPWPPIPQSILDVWQTFAGYPHPPEACLINFYGADARMGLHQDRDESEFDAPVVSISLGDTCIFRVGGRQRKGPTTSFRLASGDIVVLGGEARLAFHGVDRILAHSSTVLVEGGRINLTMRRVTKPAPSPPAASGEL